MYFRIKKSKTKFFKRTQWYYQLVGNNNETMMTSELINNKDDAVTAVNSIKRGTLLAEIIIIEDEDK